jgi:hypothetical protein
MRLWVLLAVLAPWLAGQLPFLFVGAKWLRRLDDTLIPFER